MQVIADTHVHLYPTFDLEQVFRYAVSNLSQYGQSFQHVVPAIFLSERSGQKVYADLVNERSPLRGGLNRRPARDGKGMWLEGQGNRLLVCPGRQIITAERIEILSLLSDEEISDGEATSTTFAKIRAGGGIPVFPWSPGKWLGSRGKIVANLLESADPGSLFVGDTVMRPRGSIPPRLFRTAKARNVHMVAGTDPLPIPSEVKIIGSYGITLPDGFNPEKPVASLRSCLLDRKEPIACVGRRCSWPTAASRWVRHRFFHSDPFWKRGTTLSPVK